MQTMSENALYKKDFYYDLPEELIAQTPATPRDSSRLLCYNRESGEITHRIFRDVENMLEKGDVLVVNNTKVIMARLAALNNNGREFEVLLLKRLDYTRWEALLKPAKKVKIGGKLKVSDELSLTVEGITDNGVRIIKFDFDGVFEDILDRVGNVPLPPYIKEKLADPKRYQTVYAEKDGSSAAPTAGLHFTEELLDRIKRKGVEVVDVLLHVGLGTFRPVKEENVLEHKMHSEFYSVSQKTADAVNKAIREGRRVIAVGTTSVRALESAADKVGHLAAGEGNTEIFIYPGYEFKIVKHLITNFHLPESTLLMLVSALIGKDKTMEIYKIAVEERYRFFSFGDACFFL